MANTKSASQPNLTLLIVSFRVTPAIANTPCPSSHPFIGLCFSEAPPLFQHLLSFYAISCLHPCLVGPHFPPLKGLPQTSPGAVGTVSCQVGSSLPLEHDPSGVVTCLFGSGRTLALLLDGRPLGGLTLMLLDESDSHFLVVG